MAFKTAKTTETGTNERVDPKVWLNVGYESINEETGEATFISLPLGIGLDTMRPRDIKGKMTDEYHQMLEGKNELLEQLQRYIADFVPGQEEIVGDLKVQIRRIEEATPEASEEGANPHLNNLSRLSFASNSKAA